MTDKDTFLVSCFHDAGFRGDIVETLRLINTISAEAKAEALRDAMVPN